MLRTLVRLATEVADVAALLFGRRAVVEAGGPSGYEGASMYPLLAPGDRLLFDRLTPGADRPRRGDIVLARGAGRRLIKLVAGLPGELIEVARDRLWVDGRRVDFPDGRPLVGSMPGRWQLDRDQYFLLSDAVAVGTDSRHFGPVRRGALLGRARQVYWPPGRRRRLNPTPLRPAGADGTSVTPESLRRAPDPP